MNILRRLLSLLLVLSMLVTSGIGQAIAVSYQSQERNRFQQNTTGPLADVSDMIVVSETEAAPDPETTVADVPETTEAESATSEYVESDPVVSEPTTSEPVETEPTETGPEEATVSTQVVTEPTEETVPDETVEETVSSEAMGASVIAEGKWNSGWTEYKNVRWMYDSDGTFTVYGEGEMKNVRPSEAGQYVYNANRIVIQEGITYIGQDAFGGSQASSVEIADSVTKIGDNAFCYCENLTDVKIPDSVTTFGTGVFLGCTGLESITLSNNLSNVEPYTFYGCSGLKSITIPGSVNTVGERVFDGCTSLTDVTIQEGVRRIGEFAFYNCTSLNHVSLPESLYYIDKNAFHFCRALTEITIPGNVVDIGENAFFACTGLQKLILSHNLQTIGNSAFSNCSSLGSITIPERVVSIGRGALFGCKNLTSVYFRGNAPELGELLFERYWDHKVTAYYPEGNATWNQETMKDYDGAVIWVPYTPEFTGSYYGLVSFFSEKTGNKDKDVHLDYEDSFFEQSSYTYNHDLAKASLKLAMSAFVSEKSRTGGIDGDAKNAYDFLMKIGCASDAIRDYGYNRKPTTDSIACVIGSRQLKDQEETLLIVAVRGQGYAAEWGGNFEVGPNVSYHQGFEKAAKMVQALLNGYINAMGISGSVKLWITGYSRAAATANIMAGKLMNGDASLPSQVQLDAEDLFAYTFETPAGVRSSCFPHAEKYRNIFNIINSTDFVPKVAPAIWGYERFGVDCFLPDLSSKDYPEVRKKYPKLLGDAYTYITPFGASQKNPLRQSLFLDLAIGEIGLILGGELGYYRSPQKSLIYSCAAQNGLPSFDVLFSSDLLFKGITSPLPTMVILSTIISHADQIEFGHYPENCLAMMETLTDESGYSSGKYKYYIVKCPVDIFVEDDSGTVIASIQNDAVSQIGNENVDVYVDENGDKYVFILDDADYSLQLMATDDGEMDCTVVSYQQGEGKTSQSVFFDVPLTEGERYTAPFSMSDDRYMLIGEEGTILPDADVSGSQINGTTVTAEVIGDGSVVGAGSSYTVGDTADLYAQAGEGSVFAGWYQDGTCVSREEHYSFSVKGDSAFTALFLSTDVTMDMEQAYIALKYDANQTVTEQLRVNIVPEEWKEFIAWSVETEDAESKVISVDENGMVTALNVGTAYAVAKAELKDFCFTARCRVDVAETEVVEEVESIRLDGIQLNAAKLTTELFSTNYTQFEVLLKLPQNYSAQTAAESQQFRNNGIAVEDARFTDESIAKCFDLVVLDDRTLQIVPTAEALANSKAVKGGYSGTVTVAVEGETYETEKLTLTVKKTLPKLKATVAAFNSFYAGQTQPIVITGATVTGIAQNPNKPQPDWLTLEDGALTLTESAPRKNVSGKLYLLVETEEWAIPAEVVLTVKNTYKEPALKMSTKSITLNTAVKDSAVVTVTADCDLSRLKFRLTDNSGKADKTGELTVDYENGKFTIGTTENAKGTYKLHISLPGGKEVALSIKVVSAAPSVTFKVKGNPDTNIPDQRAEIIPTFKNYNGGFTIAELTAENAKKQDATAQFAAELNGNVIRISCRPDTPAGTYTLTLKLRLDDGSMVEKTAKVSVKKTALKLKLSATKLTLNKLIDDVASIAVVSATKGYTIAEPTWQLLDKSGKKSAEGKLDIAWSDGRLRISANAATEYGATYKLLVRANADAPAQTLTITIPAEKNAKVTVALKAKGSIDVICSGSALTITPSYKNCSAETEKEETLVFSKTVGKETTDANVLFTYTKENGVFTVAKADGAALDHSAKYTVKLVAKIGETVVAESKPVNLSVKMGTAKLTVKAEDTTLFANDQHDRALVWFDVADVTLNKVSKVAFKNAKQAAMFELIDYGDGIWAIGFKDGKVDKSLVGKTVTVALNVFIEGNQTAKSNAAVNVKLTIVK